MTIEQFRAAIVAMLRAEAQAARRVSKMPDGRVVEVSTHQSDTFEKAAELVRMFGGT